MRVYSKIQHTSHAVVKNARSGPFPFPIDERDGLNSDIGKSAWAHTVIACSRQDLSRLATLGACAVPTEPKTKLLRESSLIYCRLCCLPPHEYRYARDASHFYDKNKSSIHLPIHIPVHPSTHLLIVPSIDPSIHLSSHLSMHPSIHLPIHLPMKISGPTSPLASASCQLILFGSSSVLTLFGAPPSPCTQTEKRKASSGPIKINTAAATNQNQHSSCYRHHRPIKIKTAVAIGIIDQSESTQQSHLYRFAMEGRVTL